MSRVGRPIGRSWVGRRYARIGADGPSTDINLGEVLRAQAQELLESGDVRLLMDRAFRWGYTGTDGKERKGLQQVLNDLRQRRDELRGQKALAEADETAPRISADSTTDRHARPESQDAVSRDDVQSSESGLSGAALAGPRDSSSASRSRGASSHGGEHAAPEQDAAQEMVIEDDGGMQSGFRYRQPEALANLQAELQRVERALYDLSHLGSVMSLSDVYLQRILAALGPEDADWLLAWRQESEMARRSSVGKGANARFELPPEVASAIGADMLKSLFRQVKTATGGDHATWHKGNAGDLMSESIAWEPGEPLDLDLVATMFNAVKRNPWAGRDGRVLIESEDFQVVRRTASNAVSSVLALDRSRSMGQGGGWVSAKRIALALHELIRRSYPRDSLDLLAFSSMAEMVPVKDLPLMSWDRFEHGTNLQGALALARMVLRQRRGGTRQIILVTDGEPTLASGRFGNVFSSPPDQEVMNATLREVDRCTRENIIINLILLTDSDAMRRFGHQVARYNRGRVFHASSSDVGASLLRDYVTR